MGADLRALRTLALSSGFYLLGLLVIAALAGIDVAVTLSGHPAVFLKVYVITVALAIPVVRGLLMLRTPVPETPVGIPVREAQEPRLWHTVRELAGLVGTHPPDEIVLTADVNAAVSEDTRLLGLAAGKRRLHLGLPLMIGLSEAQLRAVLVHELGHYSNADTRLATIAARGRVRVLRTVSHFEERADRTIAKDRARQERLAEKSTARGRRAKKVDTAGTGATYRLMAKIYRAYAAFYFRATLSDARRQELAADLTATRIAGRDATASAMREIAVLDAAYDFYLQSYAMLGTDAGMVPPPGEVFGGLRHFLAARRAELDELRRELPTEPPSAYDSHPPMAERIARIEALPDDRRAGEAHRPAVELLSSPSDSLSALERVALAPQIQGLRRATWPELVHRSMAWRVVQEAEPLRRATAEITGDPSLASLLDALERDALWQLADRLPKSEAAAAVSGRAAREFARPVLRRALSRLVVSELAAAGRAHWELSWTDAPALHLPDGCAELLPSALDAAVSDRTDTGPLRTLILAH
ncbi:M48 family metalloprotease [Streptomyces sp. NBC_00467]|uniref:M48 family metalloprotease n=1 Tax=Streptomyces sp. NBC_00467 TaxID=2975752 RepID=UPI002E18927A